VITVTFVIAVALCVAITAAFDLGRGHGRVEALREAAKVARSIGDDYRSSCYWRRLAAVASGRLDPKLEGDHAASVAAIRIAAAIEIIDHGARRAR
jgi:hypothetical protein